KRAGPLGVSEEAGGSRWVCGMGLESRSPSVERGQGPRVGLDASLVVERRVAVVAALAEEVLGGHGDARGQVPAIQVVLRVVRGVVAIGPAAGAEAHARVDQRAAAVAGDAAVVLVAATAATGV